MSNQLPAPREEIKKDGKIWVSGTQTDPESGLERSIQMVGEVQFPVSADGLHWPMPFKGAPEIYDRRELGMARRPRVIEHRGFTRLEDKESNNFIEVFKISVIVFLSLVCGALIGVGLI